MLASLQHRIETISFEEAMLTGVSPNLFYKLILSSNNLTLVNSYTFDGLENLIELSLDRNSINKIQPDTFSKLKSMEKLYLNKNSIPRLEPATLRQLLKLKQ